MDRVTELELLDELLALDEAGSAYLDDSIATNPVDSYTDARWFQRERAQIMRAMPQAAAHSSELPGPYTTPALDPRAQVDHRETRSAAGPMAAAGRQAIGGGPEP